MKLAKGGSLLRLVAFFVIAAVLTCTASFATSGWQSFVENEPNSDDAAAGAPSSGEVDENTDGSNSQGEITNPEPTVKHYLTGYTISPSESGNAPISFIYSSDSPLYGISNAFLTVEIPTEGGQTRYLSLFSRGTYLGKIGSIAPTRDYISAINKALGSMLIARGGDDSFEYSDTELEYLDIIESGGYSYTEYTEFHYTNSDLVEALIKNSGQSRLLGDTVKAPFIHSDTEIRGSEAALSVIIPYSDSNGSQLIYSASEGKYTLYKGANPVRDLLNDRLCTYDNVFVLFADALTHETAEATETILDTVGGGSGYYFTRGTAIKISWATDELGNLVFFNEHGGVLSVNVGTSYVAFEKSSRRDFLSYN
ncbi:MAG: DUF3048 C-terminal domain-containing protein [Clostridia bacterium]|nr:DUF3048 C-terminal domain-containing protein [Clostridia bacterium]